MRVTAFRFLTAALLAVLTETDNSLAQVQDTCTQGKGLFVWLGNCRQRGSGLSGLFTGTVRSNPPTGFTSRPHSTFNLPAVSRQPNQKQLVYHSSNKSLSEFGPDSPARFVVRCTNDELAVLLSFPGYPVSGRSGYREITYALDQGADWQAKMDSSSDFSTLGLWQRERVDNFLHTIAGARELHIETRDTDNTRIYATFKIAGLEKQLRGLCRT